MLFTVNILAFKASSFVVKIVRIRNRDVTSMHFPLIIGFIDSINVNKEICFLVLSLAWIFWVHERHASHMNVLNVLKVPIAITVVTVATHGVVDINIDCTIDLCPCEGHSLIRSGGNAHCLALVCDRLK